MKPFVFMLIMAIAWSLPGTGQRRKSANSKTATIVDSISAPPRMDGNTGKYDTVRHLKRKSRSGTRTDYNYKLHTDTIGVQRKRP